MRKDQSRRLETPPSSPCHTNTHQGTPPFTTLNGSFTTSLPKNKTNVIWASGDSAHFEESPTGSNRCVTYRLATEPGTDRLSPVPILVTGTAPVLGTWYVPPNQGLPAMFKVQARLDGRDWILSTDNTKVTSQNMVNVAVQNMSLLQPVFDIPMCIAGDWARAI
ncbi:uncharacterized protein FMAN_12106 [Fusarium mangiferae]|uniref:Uncharacterized protein n=1 Tax=Fusarium mangiferae TaxID=192010 RepID=A0A1L7TRL4_FUSMA|nr:uncharacterized protein FMAN_12106 [Fusarium mangiferae]CVK97937.1 uncharacterized protein FMAN_12106 [Fusarium mangiferae]